LLVAVPYGYVISATDGAVGAGGEIVGRVKPKEMSMLALNLKHSVFPLAVYWLNMRRLGNQDVTIMHHLI
jgi:hypothetical protein